MKNIFKAAVVAIFAGVSFSAQAADEKNFNGGYVGVEGGYQDVQNWDGGLSYAALAGARIQLDNNLVLGAEATFGSADIALLDNIWTISGSVGLVVGEGAGLAYVGAGYGEAKFSTLGTGGDYLVKAGYEHAVNKTFSIRGELSSVAFDDSKVGLALIARF